MRSISSRFRLVRSDADMDRTLYEPVRKESLDLYASTARIVCSPGTPKKRMDDLVAKAWGGFPLWRVRAMRLGEAGCFSAAAIRQAQEAYQRFIAQHEARTASKAATELTRQAALDRATLERLRDQHAAELRKLNARLALLDGGPL